MLKSLILTAIRNVFKEKGYSIINMLGLTIGITCSLFLFLYILDELSYDQHHENAETIYRVVSQIEEPDKAFNWGVTQAPTGVTLKEEYPMVENYVRFFPHGRSLFHLDDESFYMDRVFGADSTVFDVFTYPMLEGDPKNALNSPNSIVLTQEMAVRYFGNEPALGKTLTNEEGEAYKVTGVLESIPQNSHLRFNALLSLNHENRQDDDDAWGNFYVTTYVQIPTPQAANELQGLLPEMYDKYMADIFKQMGINIQYSLQPLLDIHLYSQMEGEENGSIRYLYIFGAVAIFMLIIASINYMNLATARSAKRAREVGVRKVLGSQKRTLILQFLSESLVVALASLVCSLALTGVLLPFFNEISGKAITADAIGSPTVFFSVLAAVVAVGLLGGSYPAFVLSSFQPVNVLKGKVTSGKNSAAFRKVLVVAQFSVSLTMLVCTWIVYQQLDFMRNKDLGYDHSQVLTVPIPQQEMAQRFTVFKNEVLKNPKVLGVSTASDPTSRINSRVIFQVETDNGMEDKAFMPLAIDDKHIEVLNMEIVDGRNFSEDILADTLYGVLINEETARRMNWKSPLGKKVSIPSRNSGDREPARVVGVVKDFHQQSLHSAIEPMIMVYRLNNGFAHIKLQTTEISATVAEMERAWEEVFPEKPFEYRFLDEDFQNAYAADARRGKIFTIFSLLTILIACLGLLGLASYSAEKRTKEIGIRKVIGASAPSIVIMMTRDFMVLVAIAMVIGFPIAWFSMHEWLQLFAYQISIHWSVFAYAALLTFAITFLTVSYYTFRAANANPVSSLRSE